MLQVFTHFNHALLHPVNEKLACQKLRRETDFLPRKFMFLDSLIPAVFAKVSPSAFELKEGKNPECSPPCFLQVQKGCFLHFYPHYGMPPGTTASLPAPQTTFFEAAGTA